MSIAKTFLVPFLKSSGGIIQYSHGFMGFHTFHNIFPPSIMDNLMVATVSGPCFDELERLVGFFLFPNRFD